MPIITELTEKGKAKVSRIPTGALTTAAVILACSGSFGLGYLSGKEGGEDGVYIIEPPKEAIQESASVPASSLLASPSASVKKAATPTAPAPVADSGGQYVASKSGSKYHLPWCPGAKQMKEENKIFFNSKEEAEAAGYTPAANCKGI